MMMMMMMNTNSLVLLLASITICDVYGQSSLVPSTVPTSDLMEGVPVNDAPTFVVISAPDSASSEVPSTVPVSEEVSVPSGAPSWSPNNAGVPIPPVPAVPTIPVLTLAPVTAAPVNAAPIAPVLTLAPVNAAPVALPTGGDGGAPVTSPIRGDQSDVCEMNEACAAVNLTGQCCPTLDDQFLLCCNGFIEPTCERNDKCADLGLEGACCPTAGNIPSELDGIYLDCCTTVPDACGTDQLSNGTGTTDAPSPAACPRMSAVEYKEALSQSASSAATAASTTIVKIAVATVFVVGTALLL